MFVAPATPAVTGPTLTSSTGAGHTQNTTVRGEWRADELFNLFYSVNIDVNRFECWYRVCIWAGRRSTAAGQPIRGIQPARVTRPPRPMGTVCSPCSLGLTWWRLLNKDGNKHLICSSKTSETIVLQCLRWVCRSCWVFFRKHSCGEQEVCTLPSPPLHHTSDDSNQVNMRDPHVYSMMMRWNLTVGAFPCAAAVKSFCLNN